MPDPKPDNFVSRNLPATIFANGFAFCFPHGQEWCHLCCVDHRLTNNVIMEDDLTPEQHEEVQDGGGDDRPSVSIYGKFQVLPDDRISCTIHEVVGCKFCFDFPKIVLRSIQSEKTWVSKRSSYLSN
ncbi:uncharacterized protein BJ171DRAFT_485777 [Polychytrium aggregatum]|uniref:uncharacterized protein n=1 Tax=Polychytrium aggregatum TaxID=110093 RepID=UPI0022FE6777|nr:uncharacterized protein BJ171DRAFT_485777 [Polychytrium aggregatum]KAI9209219.1 hypothetical protein BJ171DRAFT_485777 [Polychytrium aggregatum]